MCRRLVHRHPLASFFLLATTVSWLAWAPYVLSRNGLGVWGFSFPEIFGSGQIGLLPGLDLGSIGSAVAVTALADGRPGLRRWAGRMARWRVGLRWYVGTLLGVSAVILAAAPRSAGETCGPRRGWCSPPMCPHCCCRCSPLVSGRSPAGGTSRCPGCNTGSGPCGRPSCWVRSGRCGICRCSSPTGAAGRPRTGRVWLLPKIGVRSRLQAVVWAYQNRVVAVE